MQLFDELHNIASKSPQKTRFTPLLLLAAEMTAQDVHLQPPLSLGPWHNHRRNRDTSPATLHQLGGSNMGLFTGLSPGSCRSLAQAFPQHIRSWNGLGLLVHLHIHNLVAISVLRLFRHCLVMLFFLSQIRVPNLGGCPANLWGLATARLLELLGRMEQHAGTTKGQAG